MKINVYGCGGTGSHVLIGLARINYNLMRIEKPPIHVTAYDFDTVSHANVGRQAFFPVDVGHNKAKVLIQRINPHYGFNWKAMTCKAGSSSDCDLIISCVDTKKSRKEIMDGRHKKGTYLIDCGNSRVSGQVLIGQYKGDLPNPYEENEDLWKGDEPKGEPGCTDPHLTQDLFINSTIAQHACHYVWNMLRWNKTENRGVFLDIDQGICNPVSKKGT